MEWIGTGVLALAVGLPALLFLGLVATAWRLRRLRWRRSVLGLAAPESAPPQVRASLDAARPFLVAAGFHFRYTTSSERALVDGDDSPSLADVYQHADKRTHAVVTPAPANHPGEPFFVMWVTQLRSGHVLATVNCYLHKLIARPAGWRMDDGYLPDARHSLQLHLERLPENPDTILTDGVECFRAYKQAVDGIVAHCVRKGLMQPVGEHCRLRWAAAMVFAVKLLRGQKKALKARARTERPDDTQPRVSDVPAS